MSESEDVQRVLAVSGVAYPRGLLGAEAHSLAAAIAADADEETLAGGVRAVAGAHWPTLRAPIAAGVERAAARAEPEDRAAFARVGALARSEDPDNTLALALAARAGAELAAAIARVQTRLARLAPALERADGDAAVEVTRVAGEIVVDLLELDPDDFAPEIAEYAGAEAGEADVAALARSTGDEDAREWAREALRSLPPGEAARDAIVALASDPVPADASEDVVWVAAILALAAEGIEQAAAQSTDPGVNGAGAD